MKDKKTGWFYGVIYRIINMINGRDYVGSTLTFQMRRRQHIKHLRENRHYNKELQKDFNEFGEESFKTVVVVKIFRRWPDQRLQELLRGEEFDNIAPSSYNVQMNFNKIIYA